jgi:[ribosomal protein S5]-alanine N-acetyltransferase
MSVPTFETSRLILRELVESDIPAYEKHFVDYEVIRHLASIVPWPYPDGGVREYLSTEVFPKQGSDKWVWAITLKEDPSELIGCVDLWREGRPEHRGFWLGRRFWGKGYMTEAVEPVIDYAFSGLGFEKLVFTNAARNRRSARVKEKTGATFIRREPGKFVDPQFTEKEIYELTKANWDEFKKKR